jgi:hypothetical protein
VRSIFAPSDLINSKKALTPARANVIFHCFIFHQQGDSFMMSSRLQLGCLILGGCLAMGTVPAMAGNRSGVALTGSDSGTCPLAAPCRTLAYALTQTAAGGEILVMDSAGFGPINITHAVTINAPPGVIGFISAPSGDAITVNAGPTDLVIVTGLYLDGLGTGGNGVTVNTVGSFSIAGSTITGFTGDPINYVNSVSGNQHLTISNSSFYANTGSILVKPTGGSALFASIRGLSLSSSGIVVDNTSASNCKIGVLFDNSILRYNGGTAVTANSAGTSGIFVNVYIDKSELFNLNTGLVATGAGAFILMNESAAVNIATLVGPSTGAVSSIGNNMVSVGTVGPLGTTPPK